MSLRKYLKRKSYRERSQPQERQNLGLLEKHKDYVERAKKHHEQRTELENLQRAAAERNPNEFYFSMEHERTKGGIPISLEKKQSPETELQLRGKDLSFVHLRLRQETKQMEKLKARLHLVGCSTENRHVVFVETPDEGKKLKEAEFFDTPQALLDRRFNRPRKAQMEDLSLVPLPDVQNREQMEGLNQLRVEQYEALNAGMERVAALKGLEHELWLKREMTKAGEHKRVTLEDGTVTVKWKRVRK